MEKGFVKSKTGACVLMILLDIFVGIWAWLLILASVVASLVVLCGTGFAFFKLIPVVAALTLYKAAAVLGMIALFFFIIFVAVVCIFVIQFFCKATAVYHDYHKSMWNEGFTVYEGIRGRKV